MPQALSASSPETLPRTARPAVRAEWLALGSVLLAAAGQLVLKAGLTRFATSTQATGVACALAGLLIYGLGTLLWIAAVARADISYLYPLSALNYLLVACGGALLLGERIGIWRWTGIATISIGVALLVCSRQKAIV